MGQSRRDEPSHRHHSSSRYADDRPRQHRPHADRDREYDERRHHRHDGHRRRHEESGHKRDRSIESENQASSSLREVISNSAENVRVVANPQTEEPEITLHPIEHRAAPPAPEPTPVPPLDLSECKPSRVCVITVPPRGNFGNLTDANEDDFHFADHFYEKLLRVGAMENVLCYRECLPNGTTRCRMVVAFREARSAVDCVRLHDHKPYLGSKRITRCQFVPIPVYTQLLQLKPE